MVMKPVIHGIVTAVVTAFIVIVALIGIVAGIGRK